MYKTEHLLQVLVIGSQHLGAYTFLFLNRNHETTLNRLILRETNYCNARLRHYIAINKFLPSADQSSVYSFILDSLYSNTYGIIFLNATWRDREAFLIYLILAKVRQNISIAIAVASSLITYTFLLHIRHLSRH